MVMGMSNLESFLNHTTPSVDYYYPPKVDCGWNNESVEYAADQSMPYFNLSDLWRSFDEWSAYGVGVPLTLQPCGQSIVQYYVPYLSALQIYWHPSSSFFPINRSFTRRSSDESDWSDASADTRDASSDFGSDNENFRFPRKAEQWECSSCISSERLCSEEYAEHCDQMGELLMEYFERGSPYGRAPFRRKVHFLHEFCSLSKSLPLPLRSLLFSSFVQEGLFSVVTDLLGSGEEGLRLKGADILIIVLNFDASLLWKFLVNQTGQTLLGLLVTGMVTTGQAGIQSQVIEVMRMLLECETTERVPAVEKNHFLDAFYDKYMDQIMKSLSSAVSSKKVHDINGKVESPNHIFSPVSAEILGSICELLCICIQHHNYRIRNYITRNQVLEKVLQLTTRKEKHLAVAAIRVLRNCIGRKEEFYYRYIIKHDLFGPVVRAFLANGNRYNLLNSAVLELFNSLIKDNAKSLIIYSIEKYYDKLEKIDYVDTFTKLKTKYDQVLEGLITREQDSGAVNSREKSSLVRDRVDGFLESRKRKDERALDKDEEEYFNEDSDDEEDTASVQNMASAVKPAQMITVNGRSSLSGSFGLVDYEDDEDDVPTTVQNNGTEQVQAGSVTIAATDSVWLDHEEDEMIQNVKRKKPVSSVTEGRENKPEVLKRRKTVAGMLSANQDRLPSQDAATEEKAESSTSSVAQQDVKLCKDVEEVNHSDADNVSKAVESLGSVTSSAGFVKTREAGS